MSSTPVINVEELFRTRLSLSINESCAILGVSRTTLVTQIEMGAIKSSRLGKRHLIPVEEIRRLAKPS